MTTLVRPLYGMNPSGRVQGSVAIPDPVAHYLATTGVTVATGVSQWDDQSGNGNHLVQATAAKQPLYTTDGLARPIITFDGVDDSLSKAFTLSQPYTVYAVLTQEAWAAGRYIFSGVTFNAAVIQSATTPDIKAFAGVVGGAVSDLVVGTPNVMSVVFNGASSLLQVRQGTPWTGDAGAYNPGGLTVGAAVYGTSPSNISAYEFRVYDTAHDAATLASIQSELISTYSL